MKCYPRNPLLGIGLYTPAEAGRLIGVPSAKLVQWLRGHSAKGRDHAPLWSPEIDLEDEHTYLSFRDLLEARVANTLLVQGLSPQKLRRAIVLARAVMGERPLSTTWLKTDRRAVFLQIAGEDGGEAKMLELFSSQYAFRQIVDQSLRDIEFKDGFPQLWWPMGRNQGVIVDPLRSFGQPIEEDSSVPAAVLAQAAEAEGSVEAAARAWVVPVRAVRRAVAFQSMLERKQAA